MLVVLMRLNDEDPPSDDTVNLAAETAAAAKELETPYWVITMKYFHLAALQAAGRIFDVMVEFPMFLSYCDQHPNEDKGHYLLTVYKWMLFYARLFPHVSKAKIEGLMRDFDARMRRAGLSLRPLYQARMNWALSCGHTEEAARHFVEWQAAPRDAVSDCPACELHDRVNYLAYLERDEEAVGAAAPLLEGALKCVSVPDRTYGVLLAPLHRLGRREEAMNLHAQGDRRIAGKRRYVEAAAEHLTFLTNAGELEEAVRVFEAFLPLVRETKTPTPPWAKFTFMLAGSRMLRRLGESNSTAIEFRLPSSFDGPRPEGVCDLTALEEWFREQALEMARSFDERDGTDFHARRVLADDQ
jgi:hypothetical protein